MNPGSSKNQSQLESTLSIDYCLQYHSNKIKNVSGWKKSNTSIKTKLTQTKICKARQRTNLSWNRPFQLISVCSIIQTKLKTSVDKKSQTHQSRQNLLKLSILRLAKEPISLGIEPINWLWSAMTTKQTIKAGEWIHTSR